ncbi:hypothetical protein L7F22_032172 [Adiantum nelumboides]|nr:hypothetical protein [Adiantum nelumboides]
MGKKQKKRTEHEEGEQQEVQPFKRACTSKPPLIVFAHGAGAPSTSEWMLRWKELLLTSTGAVDVVTFDYPYCAGGKKGAPPKADKLIVPHTEEIRKAQSKYPGHPLVLAGKSMGSRVSCMVAGEETLEVSAIVCLGYPLKGITGALRDETLLNLRVPVMFVQGSKDGLCPLDKLQGVLKKMVSLTKLHIIESGDHSLKVGKTKLKEQGTTQEKLDETAAERVYSSDTGIAIMADRPDDVTEEVSSSQGQQTHEVGESSRPPQTEDEIFRTQLVTAVAMFTQVMQNPRFMALLQPPPPSQSIGNKKQK